MPNPLQRHQQPQQRELLLSWASGAKTLRAAQFATPRLLRPFFSAAAFAPGLRVGGRVFFGVVRHAANRPFY